MTYRLRYDRRFMRLLNALPGDIRSMARRSIKELTVQPRPARAKELEDHPGYWRMWLPRDYRLVWEILEDEKIIELLYIGPKSVDLYNRLGLGKIVGE